MPPCHPGTTLSMRLLEDDAQDGRDNCFCFLAPKTPLQQWAAASRDPVPAALPTVPTNKPTPKPSAPRPAGPPSLSAITCSPHPLAVQVATSPPAQCSALGEQNPWGWCCTRSRPDALSPHSLSSPAAAVPHAVCSCWACSSPSHVAAAPSGLGRQRSNHRRPCERPVRGPGGRELREMDRTRHSSTASGHQSIDLQGWRAENHPQLASSCSPRCEASPHSHFQHVTT